jgi:putative sterol carrier protein
VSVKFLSEDWTRAVKEGLNSDEEFRKAAGTQRARIQQVIMSDEGDLRYWIELADGAVDVGTGPIDDPTVTVTSDYETAEELAKGELSVTSAFLGGRVRVTNVMSAMGLQGVLVRFGAVVKELDTEY